MSHPTFGIATLIEQPPRPEGACRVCKSDAWHAGAGCWVCTVCHPLDPKPPGPWKERFPKVNAWEGALEQWVALYRRDAELPPFTVPVEKPSKRKGKRINVQDRREA